VEEQKHSSIVGGSTANVRKHCNASIYECAKVPNNTSIYAATGSALHKVVELAIRDELSDASVLKRFTDVKFSELLDSAEDIKAFGDCVMTEELLIKKALPALHFFDEEFNDPNIEIQVEQKVNLEEYIKSAFGYTDIIFKGPRNGIVDWKFGDGIIVKAEDNDQMRFYLASAISTGLLPPDQKKYEAIIFQPAESNSPSKYVQRATYTYSELNVFVEQLATSVNGEKKYVVGPHCKSCRGKVACEYFKKYAIQKSATDVSGLDSEQLEELLEFVDSLSEFIKEVKSIALRNALEHKVKFSRHVLEQGLSNRKYIDPAKADRALARLLTAKERYVKTLVSPTVADKLLSQKEDVDPVVVEKFFSKHVTREPTAFKLVRCEKGAPSGGIDRLAEALKTKGLK
jgi:hypothetical protein